LDDKGGFDTDLRRALRELNENVGECPSAEVLEAYARGRLPTGEITAIRKHLTGCGICELVVERLQTLDVPDWRATEKKLRKGLGIASDAQPAWRRILWNPVPAYALAAALAISLGITRRTPVPAPPGMPAPQAVIGVPTVLSFQPETRGGFHVTRPAAQGRSDIVLLKFFVPIRKGSTYLATILSGSGVVVAPKQDVVSQNGLGDFYLTCDGRLLGTGDYVLRVKESGGENRGFEFPFQYAVGN
jgi:hypothetical protein